MNTACQSQTIHARRLCRGRWARIAPTIVAGVLFALLSIAAPAAAQDEALPAGSQSTDAWPFPSDGAAQLGESATPISGAGLDAGITAPPSTPPTTTADIQQNLLDQGMKLPDLTSRENLAPALQLVILLTVLSLAPAILVLCTSFTRIIIVLSLLRQALGTQNLPPNQVLIGLALFMTFVIMGPTWERINGTAIQPYLNGGITQQEALETGVVPLREFMIAQIQAAGNDEAVLMFHEFAREAPLENGEEVMWGDFKTTTIIPAFVLSELKVAFLMGFKIYLPFLIVDMVISAVLISMGMMMLPPVLISLPFKLLLFVLVDGWVLLVGSLMTSFALAGGG